MKTKAFLLTLALVGSCFAEDPKGQPNPEVAKIDARLVELKLVWNRETATINRLTNFKKTPVQEGSQAYLMCLAASKKIQQAEAEGKELTARRAALQESSGATPGTVATGGGGTIDETVARMRAAWDDSYKNEQSKDSANSKTVSPEVAAAELFTQYDPRKYIHPTELASPTLSFLGAKVELKGEGLKEISDWIDKKNWLALVNQLLKKSFTELPETEIIEKAANILANTSFYIYLTTTTPPYKTHVDTGFGDGDFARFKECLLPRCFLPESDGLKFWESQMVFDDLGHLSGENGWNVHPEKTGFLKEWHPTDGPVIFACIVLPGKPTLEKQLDSMKPTLQYLADKLKQKKKLGEIDSTQYRELWLKGRENALRQFLLWASKL